MPIQISAGIFPSLALLFSTLVGAAPILFFRSFSNKQRSFTEGFCAGAMLAASFLSLLLPGLNQSTISFLGFSPAIASLLFLLAGYFGMFFLHESLPHFHEQQGNEGKNSHQYRKTWLLFFAVALHNLPEGFSVGVGIHQSNPEASSLLAAICMQNLPEGFIVAGSLLAAGEGYGKALILSAATAIVEFISCLVGYFSFQALLDFLPWALLFSAGAMLFVICREMIPESQKEYPGIGSSGIMVGIFAILILREFF